VNAPSPTPALPAPPGLEADALLDLDATALAQRLRSGEGTAEQATRAALARARAREPAAGAFLELLDGAALERARALDRARRDGAALGALHGVPVALKANLALAGSAPSCASRVLAGYRSPFTATAVQRLLDAGAVPIGIANMDEFAMGSSGEHSSGGPTRNPWDSTRTPGGSSSGSAAAVAARVVPLALGSDTGGSVRQPAALCGILAHKPSWGRVSRFGLVAFASSLDCVAPLARSARDLTLALELCSGADPRDATCLDLPPIQREPRASLAGLRAGVVREFRGQAEASVERAFERTLAELSAVGVELLECSLPSVLLALPAYYVISSCEAASNLARFDGVRFGARQQAEDFGGLLERTRAAGLGAEVQRRILMGSFALSSGYQEQWYGRACAVRDHLSREFAASFEQVDVLLAPTAPELAFRLGERRRDPLAMYRSDLLTVPASLAGLPAASVPCAFVGEGNVRLPVGLQLLAPRLADARLCALVEALEGLLAPQWTASRGAP
jgi:aspartyl-tRNA(Asn)/glutamyl-tRNA(Gln) amidotransferase subunit A